MGKGKNIMEIFYELFLTGDFSKKKNNMKIIQISISVIAIISYIFLGILVALLMALLYGITIIISNLIFVDYEYTLTNNELDIAKISNNSRRKVICTIDISKVSGVSKLENNNGQAKYKKCYVGNENLKTIVITAPYNGEKTNFGLKINEELLILLKRINPSSFNTL